MIDIHHVTDNVKKIVPKQATHFWQDFKSFAFKGNMIDLAVGIVIGTAFNSIINSLVNDIIMPLIATLFGKPDFSSITLGNIMIGNFITHFINFLIIALSVFLVLKFIFRNKTIET